MRNRSSGRAVLSAYMVFFVATVVAYVGLGDVEALARWSAWSMVVAMGLGVTLAVGTKYLASVVPACRQLEDGLGELVSGLSPSDRLVVALLSAVSEEFAFRGVLQPSLGLWITAALFAAVHLGPDRRFWVWPLVAGVGGLAFGILFEVTGSLAAVMVAHGLANVVSMRRLGAGVDRALPGRLPPRLARSLLS